MFFNYSIKGEFSYHLDHTDYYYEDDRFLFIGDFVLPKSKHLEVDKRVKNALYSDGLANPDTIFLGGFFILKYDKFLNKIDLYRDQSGIKTGYYSYNNGTLSVSSLIHKLRFSSKGLNTLGVDMLNRFDYLFDGYTIYDEINEVPIGNSLNFDDKLQFSVTKSFKIELATEDNNLLLEENINRLRELTNQVHDQLAGTDNLVYLSGGIDSCVMLGALHDVCKPSEVRSVSFRVKGTDFDETFYAKRMADHLGIDLEIKESDPSKIITLDEFENVILGMNNPYPGYWIFKPEPSTETVCFAGQDTRLHTPDINTFDQWVFSRFMNNGKVPFSNLLIHTIGAFHKLLSLNKSDLKPLRYADRLAAGLDPLCYVNDFILKMKGNPVADHIYENDNIIAREFDIDYSRIKNKRQLYNEIVKVKWRQQYTDDIRYLQDMARMNNAIIAMPFYDYKLAQFSSSIPFHWATKYVSGSDKFSEEPVKVNKFVLREAYKDKLPESVLYRKKAVSPTLALFFNGPLGSVVRKVVEQDLKESSSFIKNFGYTTFAHKYLSRTVWQVRDQEFLNKVYYMAALCVYHKNCF